MRECAQGFARRVRASAEVSDESAIRDAFAIALSRPPSEAELAETIEFLKSQTASYESAGTKDAADAALADFCQALMGLNEFVYVE